MSPAPRPALPMSAPPRPAPPPHLSSPVNAPPALTQQFCAATSKSFRSASLTWGQQEREMTKHVYKIDWVGKERMGGASYTCFLDGRPASHDTRPAQEGER